MILDMPWGLRPEPGDGVETFRRGVPTGAAYLILEVREVRRRIPEPRSRRWDLTVHRITRASLIPHDAPRRVWSMQRGTP